MHQYSKNKEPQGSHVFLVTKLVISSRGLKGSRADFVFLIILVKAIQKLKVVAEKWLNKMRSGD